jgi:hypothetical protein
MSTFAVLPRSKRRWLAALLPTLVCPALLAEPAAGIEPATSEVARAPSRIAVLAGQAWPARFSAERSAGRSAEGRGIAVVELPVQVIPGAGPQRAHHAFSISSDGPQRMLRSMGIEATDCATRFRLPSKIRQDQGSGLSLELKAHLGFSCRF